MTPTTAAREDAHAPSWARLLRAANPGPMTLDGTNTWLLRSPSSPDDRIIVVDPGPALPEHLAAIESAGTVALILITHWHPDHTEAAADLAARTGAPVRAHDPKWCVPGTTDATPTPLADGQTVNEAGLSLRVRHTPGHTADSVSLTATSGPEPAVLTGDTVLGRGTTVVMWPDGDLGAYLASLDLLASYGDVPVLPGHGPTLPSLAKITACYRAHREDRLDQVRAALTAGAATPMDVVALVYADVDRAVWPAAEATVRAQLAYLGADIDVRDREHNGGPMELGEP